MTMLVFAVIGVQHSLFEFGMFEYISGKKYGKYCGMFIIVWEIA